MVGDIFLGLGNVYGAIFANAWEVAGLAIAIFGSLLFGVSVVMYVLRRQGSPPSSSAPCPPSPIGQRIGTLNRPGGRAKITNAYFGPKLDIGIDNQGELEAHDTRYE